MDSFQIVLLVLFNVVLTGFAVYWGDYMKAKGKNLATKEDVEEITKLTGQIKHELALVKESQIGFQTLRREAIVNYYIKYFQMLNLLMSAGFENVVYQTALDQQELIEVEYNNAQSKLKLFVEEFYEFTELIEFNVNGIEKLHVEYFTRLEEYIVTEGIIAKNGIALAFYSFRAIEFNRLSPALHEMTEILRDLIRGGIAA